jgi:outer membrane biosynthesis protein TonB
MSDKNIPASDAQLSQIVRQENLKNPLRWVVGLHIAIIVIAAIGLPSMKKEPFDLTQAVAVDLVAPTGDVSSAPNKTKSPEPFQPKAKPVEQKKPAIAKPEKPPSKVKEEAAKKEVAPVPPKPAEQPKPVEAKEKIEQKKEAIEKAPEPKKEPVKKPIEKPKPKPTPKPTPQKSRDDGAGSAQEQKEFNSVLKNLLGDPETEAEAPAGNPIDAPYDPNTKVQGTAPVTSDTLALSEMDALKYQLAQCWNVPTGAMDAENLIVDIRIEVNPDRTVKSAQIVDQGRYNTDEFFRAAADSARRAVYNPRCTPLALPPDKYQVWQNIMIRFNPKDMFGG